ncbi:MAG TPA: ribonuclease III [Firmicutes bacterium]|nr:ribonuclease III [Bacillota bacterium]
MSGNRDPKPGCSRMRRGTGCRPRREQELVAWCQRTGVPPGVSLPLLDQALCHASAVSEGLAAADNERLEFLGDAVINLLAAEYFYRNDPDLKEGGLARRRAAAVRTETLARLGRDLGLGPLLLLGKGGLQSGVGELDSVLASTFEAVVGAVYLSLPPGEAFKWLFELLTPVFHEVEAAFARGAEGNFKSELQEEVQQVLAEPPCYRVVGTSGPPHDPYFEVEVTIRGEPVARGSGRSKKEAEQAAARAALASEGLQRLLTGQTGPGGPL